MPGAIERWNSDDARGTDNFTLPAGVNLQLNTNLSAARTISLNGGGIEAFLPADHVAPTAYRTIGANVVLNLLADSTIGQNGLQGTGYDAGRLPTVGQPFAEAITGSFLEIKGTITGAGKTLTKTGQDTLILSGTGNTYGRLIVDMGIVRTTRINTFDPTSVLTTRFNGVVDLYGFAQTVSGLGTLTGNSNLGGVGRGFSGKITDGAPTNSTLTIDNNADYTYDGTIERTIALTKTGTGTLTLANPDNTYVNPTRINGGKLEISTLADGGIKSSIGAADRDSSFLTFDGGALRYTGENTSTDKSFTLFGGGGTIEVTDPGTSVTASGIGIGGGDFTKDCPGFLEFVNSQALTGKVTINDGKLILQTGAKFDSSPEISVKENGKLDVTASSEYSTSLSTPQLIRGKGEIDGNLKVESTSTVRGGNSIGTLTIVGNLTVKTGGRIYVEIAGAQSSALYASNGGSTTGTLPATPVSNNYINVQGILDLAPGTIIDIDGTGATFAGSFPFSYKIGRANSFASGVLITSNLQFNFIGINVDTSTLQLVSVGNDLILNFTTVVPEPALLLGLGGVIGVMGYRRRKVIC
ncbi:hypothetical protein BH11PLA2_BH11PLA2_39010 [soil metagenome]